MGAAELGLYRSQLLEEISADDVRDKAGQQVYAVWTGNAGVCITDGENGILIDPFVSRHGMLKVGLGCTLPVMSDVVSRWTKLLSEYPINAIIVSHSHYDHALDAPEFARALGVPVIGTESTANICRGSGLGDDLIRVVTGGDVLEFGRISVGFRESTHGPALFGRVPFPGTVDKPFRVGSVPARAYRMGGVFGIVVSHPAGTVVHHGSAGHVDGMYDDVDADVLMLGLAGRADTAEYLSVTADPLGVSRIIPVHCDNMFAPIDEPFSFLPTVRYREFLNTVTFTRPDISVEMMPRGKPVRILPGNGHA